MATPDSSPPPNNASDKQQLHVQEHIEERTLADAVLKGGMAEEDITV